MFLNQDRLDAMSISEARRMGYMVDSTPNRVVFRSAYNQPHSTITEAGETKIKGIVHIKKKKRESLKSFQTCMTYRSFSETQKIFWKMSLCILYTYTIIQKFVRFF